MAVEFTLGEIARLVEGRIIGNPERVLNGIAPIEEAGPEELAFLWGRKFKGLLDSTRAGAVILNDESLGGTVDRVIVKNPQLALATLLEVFRPQSHPAPGVHPASDVSTDASIGEAAFIGPFTVVGAGARIGARSVLYPNVYVGPGAVIGEDAVLYPGVIVREGCRVGNRVVIHSNSVVGSDGFGYVRVGASHRKIPQRGVVNIGDDVEIGACVTIDRATIGETTIGRGTKIDNLVQVAHNVRIGEDAIVVAQVGIAGSAVVGSRVQLAGQAGINGHITIGDDSAVGAQSGVVGDVPKGSVVSGMPAIPHTEWLKAMAVVARLPELNKRIADLEKRLKSLEAEGKR